ncbi:hypothetical protein [Clostridium sp.]|uniref:hypothetical protein n=1 Tax=Clostridium sp. TaxID=1506 RepID=UPI002A848441|nr:hypothetical protein [Clostridium sp.]
MKIRAIALSLVIVITVGACCIGCKHKNDDESEKEATYYVVNIQNTKPSKEINDGEKIIERFVNLKTNNIAAINFDVIGAENLKNNLVFQEPYTMLEGVTTFRGNNYRTSPSFGKSNVREKKLETMWKFTTSSSTWGGGAGWTGKPSREKIYVGNPIKGTLTIDPRGIPLLYVGEGINEGDVVGLNIFSLIDGRKLYELSGWDSNAYRGWPAFDSSPLVHGATDTVIDGGENGLLYIMKLNTNYDEKANSIPIDPKITKYRYRA